ncbi:unnamed protein product [Polarella glacialis]|uniref:Sulfotransferase n=1 Tax=Polarella glacialis TaxID=89957 RepID=A0A813FXI0_POLGL|nr:unnamed protein product [Polarella glacialis]
MALVGRKPHGRVLLCFRDHIRYIVSTFNRYAPDAPGGSSFLAVVTGADRDPDPYGLQLWKGNYSALAKEMMAAVGHDKVFLQPFELLLEAGTKQGSFARLLAFLGSEHKAETKEGTFPHFNPGPSSGGGRVLRVDPCADEHRPALRQLEALFTPEYVRLKQLLLRMGQDVPPSVSRGRPDWAC